MDMQDLIAKSSDAATLLKALGNASRLRVLCELHKGERSVAALVAAVGLSQSALSQHLAKLRGAGIVATRREAQTIFYSVADPRAAKLLGTLYEIFCASGAPRQNRRRER